MQTILDALHAFNLYGDREPVVAFSMLLAASMLAYAAASVVAHFVGRR